MTRAPFPENQTNAAAKALTSFYIHINVGPLISGKHFAIWL